MGVFCELIKPDDCTYCRMQPGDYGPCQCAHVPCVHDANSYVREIFLRLLGRRFDRVRRGKND